MTIYDEIEQASKANSQFFKLNPGEKAMLKFDEKKIQVVEAEFNGQKKKRVRYGVVNVNRPGEEKFFEISMAHSTQLNAFLKRGFMLLEVERIGGGKETRYNFVPGV